MVLYRIPGRRSLAARGLDEFKEWLYDLDNAKLLSLAEFRTWHISQ